MKIASKKPIHPASNGTKSINRTYATHFRHMSAAFPGIE